MGLEGIFRGASESYSDLAKFSAFKLAATLLVALDCCCCVLIVEVAFDIELELLLLVLLILLLLLIVVAFLL